MTRPLPNTILITGATGAIGQALALYYAKPGIHLLLQGRNTEGLTALAETCQEQGATVTMQILDLRDIACLQQWLGQLTESNLPDLIIANAGININQGSHRCGETWQDIDALLDINIKATFALVNALLPALRQRGSGQIALISSLAAYHGLPITPSYCASKAALKAYGEGMRGWLAREGIHINVVMPGYIKSAMCDAMPGPKPFLISPEIAARRIAKGLVNNQARISFPFPLNFGTWLLAALPTDFSLRLLRLINYGG